MKYCAYAAVISHTDAAEVVYLSRMVLNRMSLKRMSLPANRKSQSFVSIIAVRLGRAWNGKSPSVVRLGACCERDETNRVSFGQVVRMVERQSLNRMCLTRMCLNQQQTYYCN